MIFKRVRKGYDPVQVDAFIKIREEQNNGIIEKQQRIIDAQAEEIKNLERGIDNRTVSGLALLTEAQRAAFARKCEIFGRTCDLFERLVKNKLNPAQAEQLEAMSAEIEGMKRAFSPEVPSATTVNLSAVADNGIEDSHSEGTEKHLLEFEEILKGDFTLENMLEDLKEL